MLQLLLQILKWAGPYILTPYFHREIATNVIGRPIDPKLSSSLLIVESPVNVSFSQQFVKESISRVHRHDANGVLNVGFTFNLEAFQSYQFEMLNHRLESGEEYQVHPGYQIDKTLKSLVYRALLTIEKHSHEKIKFHEIDKVTNQPVVFIAHCGQQELRMIDGFSGVLQYDHPYVHRGLVCFRKNVNYQYTLRVILHELMHALGVGEIRESKSAIEILKQKDAGYSSIMFYDIDRRHNQLPSNFTDFNTPFIGSLDKAFLNEVTRIKSSDELQAFGLPSDVVYKANAMRQFLISFTHQYIYMFVALRVNKKAAGLIARSVSIALLYYLDSASSSMVLQLGLLLMESIFQILRIDSGKSAIALQLMLFGLTIYSVYEHVALFKTHHQIELLGQWLGCTLGLAAGQIAAETSSYVASTCLPYSRRGNIAQEALPAETMQMKKKN